MILSLTTKIGLFAAPAIFLLASEVGAEEFCIVPVKGGEARLPIEFDQPYRIGASPRTVPGFEGLVVKALNRHELYEFDGSNLTLVEDTFPHVWGFAFEYGIHPRPDGEAFGFGSRPRGIFHLEAGDSKWEMIEATKDYLDAFIDQGSGDVYWRSPSSDQLNSLAADGSVERIDLPKFHGYGTVSVRTIPELKGALALTDHRSYFVPESTSLWFRPFGRDWQKVSINLPDGHRLLPTFHDAQVEYSEGLLRVFPASRHFEPLVFRSLEQGLEFVESLPAGDWVRHIPSQSWIGLSRQPLQDARHNTDDSHAEGHTPQFLVLRPEEIGAHEISSVIPRRDVVGSKTSYHPNPIVVVGALPALLRSETGLVAYDRGQVWQEDSLLYDVIGAHPTVMALGPLNIVQSEKAVFVLHDDLSLRRIDSFPFEAPWPHNVDLEYVEAWGAYIVVDRGSGEAYFSWDMERFTRIESEERLDGVVGVLSEPASILAVGQQKLVSIRRNCRP